MVIDIFVSDTCIIIVEEEHESQERTLLASYVLEIGQVCDTNPPPSLLDSLKATVGKRHIIPRIQIVT